MLVHACGLHGAYAALIRHSRARQTCVGIIPVRLVFIYTGMLAPAADGSLARPPACIQIALGVLIISPSVQSAAYTFYANCVCTRICIDPKRSGNIVVLFRDVQNLRSHYFSILAGFPSLRNSWDRKVSTNNCNIFICVRRKNESLLCDVFFFEKVGGKFPGGEKKNSFEKHSHHKLEAMKFTARFRIDIVWGKDGHL